MNKLTLLEIIRQINALKRIDFGIYECKRRKRKYQLKGHRVLI